MPQIMGMGNTLISTVGETEAPILEGIRFCGDIRRIILLSSKDTSQIAEKIAEKIQIYEVRHVLVDAFDFSDVVNKIVEVSREQEGSLVFDITGGTKIMSSAAVFSASFLNAKVLYIQYKNDKMSPLWVPVVRISLKDYLRPMLISLLKILSEKDGISYKQIAKTIDLSVVAVSSNMEQLRAKGLVEVEKGARTYKSSLTPLGRLVLSIGQVNEK